MQPPPSVPPLHVIVLDGGVTSGGGVLSYREKSSIVTAPVEVSPSPTEIAVAPAGTAGVVQVKLVHVETLAARGDWAQ